MKFEVKTTLIGIFIIFFNYLIFMNIFLYSLIKILLLSQQMHFHGSDMKSLQKFLDPSILPANYKGTLPAINYGGVEWFPALEKQAEYVAEWSQLGPAQW